MGYSKSRVLIERPKKMPTNLATGFCFGAGFDSSGRISGELSSVIKMFQYNAALSSGGLSLHVPLGIPFGIFLPFSSFHSLSSVSCYIVHACNVLAHQIW